VTFWPVAPQPAGMNSAAKRRMLSIASPVPMAAARRAGTVRIRDAESVLYGDLDPDAARQAAAGLGPSPCRPSGSR
jgi:hypothetical protein